MYVLKEYALWKYLLSHDVSFSWKKNIQRGACKEETAK